MNDNADKPATRAVQGAGQPRSDGPDQTPETGQTPKAFLAHMRHELRTPINAILGYSEMLLEDAAGGGADAFVADLQKIHAAGNRLLARVNQIMDPAKLEAGQLDLSTESFSANLHHELRTPINAILGYSETLMDDAAVGGREAFGADLQKIHTAANQFLAFIDNLIIFSTTKNGDQYFEQLTADASAMIHEVVTTDRPLEEIAAKKASLGQSAVLVVDDNEINRDVLSRRLERQGYAVAVAEDGHQALEMLATQRFDLVLLDIMMPKLNGYQVLQRLKTDPVLRDIPVIMISALDDLDSVVRCIEMGAEDYLPKPFNPVLLRARINACLDKKRLRDELCEWNKKLEERVQEQVAQLDRLGRLKGFFSPHLAESIVNGGGEDLLKTHRREVVVVFLDLRGFTAFTDGSEPEEVMGVLGEYHRVMGRLIMAHEGTLERFAGDGMMIFFNDPISLDNPTANAVKMALEMQEQFVPLRTAWKKRGYGLDLGIGIAQGYATLGAIGFEGRWDYACIGSVTNLAARLCGEAKGGQILTNQKTLARIEDTIQTDPLGEITLKGITQPVPVFNVVAFKS